jgi:hypothetical protein
MVELKNSGENRGKEAIFFENLPRAYNKDLI